jgi:hypothetical protein
MAADDVTANDDKDDDNNDDDVDDDCYLQSWLSVARM